MYKKHAFICHNVVVVFTIYSHNPPNKCIENVEWNSHKWQNNKYLEWTYSNSELDGDITLWNIGQKGSSTKLRRITAYCPALLLFWGWLLVGVSVCLLSYLRQICRWHQEAISLSLSEIQRTPSSLLPALYTVSQNGGWSRDVHRPDQDGDITSWPKPDNWGTHWQCE